MKSWLSKIMMTVLAAACLSFAGAPLGDGAKAMGSKPKAKRKCIKYKKRKGKRRCVKWRKAGLTDPQIYYVGYTLANQGDYESALSYLHLAKNKNDPKINTYIGFSMRKLGNVDGALVYYNKVLKADPDSTLARAYMGEAFLQKGEPVKAREQLAEIAKRCGTNCTEYDTLFKQIVKFEARKA